MHFSVKLGNLKSLMEKIRTKERVTGDAHDKILKGHSIRHKSIKTAHVGYSIHAGYHGWKSGWDSAKKLNFNKPEQQAATEAVFNGIRSYNVASRYRDMLHDVEHHYTHELLRDKDKKTALKETGKEGVYVFGRHIVSANIATHAGKFASEVTKQILNKHMDQVQLTPEMKNLVVHNVPGAVSWRVNREAYRRTSNLVDKGRTQYRKYKRSRDANKKPNT